MSHVIPPEFGGIYGRLRSAMLGPAGALYVTTSNGSGQDRILRIVPSQAPAFPAERGTYEVAENSRPSVLVTTVQAIDPDGDRLTYALRGPDAAAFSMDANTGQLRIGADTVLDRTNRASYEVIATATDGYGLSDSITLTIVVTPGDGGPGPDGGGGAGGVSANRPPVPTDPLSARTLELRAAVEVTLSEHFRDPEGRAMTYTAESADVGVATVGVENGVLTIRGVDHGVTRVTVTATDDRRLTATQSFEVTVGRVVSFANRAVSVPEGGTATLTVGISRALGAATTLDYVVAGDGVEATPDADEADHGGRDGMVTIAAQGTQARIEIKIVDDAEIEAPRETFAVTLRAAPYQAEDFGLDVATAVVTIDEGSCDRTAQVRDALRGSLPCTAVSETDLAGLRTLNLADASIDALRAGDFSVLTGLRALDLSGNSLTELPACVFAGLGRLTELGLHGNPGAPFPLTIRLLRTDADVPEPGPASVVAQVSEGAPFALRAAVSATGGTLRRIPRSCRRGRR